VAATRPHRTPAESSGGPRSSVAATSYLHIQASGEPTSRVLELGSGSVRVGRGIQCEVRLNQVGLGDVQCILRRRGDDWHFQPVGPPGRIWIDGRPADNQQVLPPFATLQVGRFRLKIQEPEPTEQVRGSFDAPITVGAEPVDPTPTPTAKALPQSTPLSPPDPPEPAANPDPSTGDDRVKRWQSRLDQRDQWLKDRQSEKRWEARWKAAGETIRARSAPVVPPSATSPGPDPVPTSTSPPIVRPSVGRSTHARVFEPRPVFGPHRRVADVEPKPEPPRVPLRLKADVPAEAPSPRPSEDESAPGSLPEGRAETNAPIEPNQSGLELKPRDPTTIRPLGVAIRVPSLPNPRVEAISELPPATILALELFPTVPVEPVAAPAEAPVAVEMVQAPSVEDEVEAESPSGWPGSSDPGLGSNRRAPGSEDPGHPRDFLVSEDSGLKPLVELAVAPPIPVAKPALAEPAPAKPSPKLESPPKPAPATPGSKDWPSARAIFDAQGTRATAGVAREPQAVAEAPRKRPTPVPTEATRPDAWTIPLWLGWLPSVLIVAALGLFSVGLAVIWVEDASSGNLAIRLATRPEGTSPPIDALLLPNSAWWRTTASHLAAWALTLERVGNGEDRTIEARSMEADARSVSPLGARSRFASEPVPGQEADASASIRLGPTRDVVTLTAMAHRLRRDGKRSDAIRAYRAAFLTGSTTARSTLSRPIFRENPQIGRYALPHSSLLDEVARDMGDSGEWTPEEWAEAVPDFGPARLAVAIAIRPKDPAEAERRFKAICQDAELPLDPRFEASEHKAAIAEALAEQGRWGDSVERYRQAIEGETRDLDRRVWWFNLAEVARKNGDEATRNQAIESAKGQDLSDEVTQRAANANKNALDSNLSAQNRSTR